MNHVATNDNKLENSPCGCISCLKSENAPKDITGPLSLIKKKKSYDMSSDNFQFMGVQSMDELLKQRIALELPGSDPIDNMNKDIVAINHVLLGLTIPEEEKKMLLFLIEDIVETAKTCLLEKEEKGE